MRKLGMALGVLLAGACLAEVVPFSGTVLGPDGQPVAGAQVAVELFNGKMNQPQATTVTDKDGKFSVELNASKARVNYYFYMLVYAPGFAIGGGMFREREVTIHLRPAGTASGLVVDVQGKPVAGTAVTLRQITTLQGNDKSYVSFQSNDLLKEHYSTLTDADGRWTLGNVPLAGDLQLYVDDPRFLNTRFTITLPQNTATTFPIIAHPAGTITGRVRFADGKPAPGVRVFVESSDESYQGWGEVTTGADGGYSIGSLPAGRVNVMVEEPSGQWVAAALENVRVTAGKTTQAAELVLTAGAIVEGTITDEETGQLIPNVSIGSYGPHHPRSSDIYVRPTQTFPEGRYRLRVAPGKSYIFLGGSHDDYLMPEKGVDITLKAGETKTLPFRLRRGLIITGTLVDTDEQPIRDTDIQLVLIPVGLRRNVEARRAKLDGAGAFTVTGLEPGKWRLSASAANGQSPWDIFYPQDIILPTDKPIKVILNKMSEQTLSGRVVTRAGTPLSGASVELRWPQEPGKRYSLITKAFVSDADGVFNTTQMRTDAKITLARVQQPGYSYLSGGTVSMVDGKLHMTDIIMTPLTGQLTGQVLGVDGAPLAGVKVIALEVGTDSLVTTDATGNFSLRNLPEGAITLLAVHQQKLGRVNAETSDGPVRLQMAALPTPPAQDMPRAYALLETLLQDSADTDYYARYSVLSDMAHYDLALAIKLAKSAGMEGFIGMLAWSLRDSRVELPEEVLAEFQRSTAQMEAPPEKMMALGLIGARLAKEQPTRSRECYAQAKALAGQLQSKEEQAVGYLMLALLAGALDNGEGEGWIDRCIAIILEMKEANEALASFAEIIAVYNPAMAEKMLMKISVEKITDEREGEPSIAAEVVVIAARVDAQLAARMLKSMPQDGGEQAEYSYGYAAKAVVAAVAKDDPAAVVTLARTIKTPEFRAVALADVAAYQPPETARQMFNEAAALLPRNGEGTQALMEMAAAAYRIDPETGVVLFAQARSLLGDTLARKTTFAYYYRVVDAAESRLLLEEVYRQMLASPDPMNPDWSLQRVALAMAPLDFDRALEIARAIPEDGEGNGNTHFDTRRKLAQYLLAPADVRATIPLDRWDCSDSWIPGTPTDR